MWTSKFSNFMQGKAQTSCQILAMLATALSGRLGEAWGFPTVTTSPQVSFIYFTNYNIFISV